MASHVVDVTDGNSAGFAKALKLTAQSFLLDLPRSTRSRTARSEQTGAQQKRPSPKAGQKLSDLRDSEDRSGGDCSEDDDNSTASHPSHVVSRCRRSQIQIPDIRKTGCRQYLSKRLSTIERFCVGHDRSVSYAAFSGTREPIHNPFPHGHQHSTAQSQQGNSNNLSPTQIKLD